MKKLIATALMLSCVSGANAAEKETTIEVIKEKVSAATDVAKSKMVAATEKVTSAVGIEEENPFKVSSPDYNADEPIAALHLFNGFGCEGENISPALSWHGAPIETKSYAVTIYDPDAPTGSGWWHWVVYNIPANVTSLEMAASSTGLPEGAVQVRNDYSEHAYGGPCPPVGDEPHRYIVTVHALNAEVLKAPKDASPALVGFMLNEHGIAKTELTAKYGR
ncbi:MAG: YbhB/YbcL family Raf kinase inhibitor-like protein [Alphaproteobacteria bacterium]|nr:YbhB/YbcL family Raf kinase inhibitor-like protein [Alphaproteobacteria bacterium]